ncbi:hypothetical protein WICMUC_000447 [Wickerhamomyces mucosus]|uniref:Major facilitator superfamily (MFS) profile domain-containing protein n=1 Tax=Wickerhamomyces mucosus TaxID=1378264 RepID=A0A9P8PZ85_9ASCO|nr:hypothetical protein WICMUC_000447 [Wickerhamomyces mucosus]
MSISKLNIRAKTSEIDFAANSDFESDQNINNHSDHNKNDVDWEAIREQAARYERKKLLRRFDYTLLPTLAAIFFVFSLDRSNLSQVLTDNFLEDIGINQNVSNAAVSILWGAICIGDIPSNMLLSRVGARHWIPVQVILWGLVSTFQAFITNKNQFLATRFLLGLCESGFIPNSMALLASYTTREEYGKRVVLYFYGSGVAGMFGPLMASGILQLRGRGGWAGWRYLWVIEGSLTILFGVLSYFLLPKSLEDSKTVLFGQLLNDDELRSFKAQLKLKDLSIAVDSRSIRFSDVKKVLKDWRIYPHFFMALTGLPAYQPTNTYGSLILKQLGFNKIDSNLLAIPWSAGGLITSLTLVTISDKFNDRSLPMLVGSLWQLILAIVIKEKSATLKGWKFYALYTIYQVSPSWHNINAAWIAENQSSYETRSIVLALYFTAANAAAIPGGQVFRANDKPYYKKGWIAILVLFVFLNAAIISQRIQYILTNKRKAKKFSQLTEEEKESYIIEKLDPASTKSLDFKHHL